MNKNKNEIEGERIRVIEGERIRVIKGERIRANKGEQRRRKGNEGAGQNLGRASVTREVKVGRCE